jgi:hypothetical protein
LPDTLIHRGYHPVGSHIRSITETGKNSQIPVAKEKRLDKISIYNYNRPYSSYRGGEP